MKKRILALLLVLCLLLSSLASCGFRWFGGTSETTEGGAEAETDDTQLNQNVTAYDEQLSAALEDSIISAEQTEEKVVLKVDEASPLVGLSENEVFVVQGEEDSMFGELYFGKVEKITEENGEYLYDIVTPAFDEVFDAADFDMDLDLSYENINSVTTLPGVTIVSGADADTAQSNTGASTMKLASFFS